MAGNLAGDRPLQTGDRPNPHTLPTGLRLIDAHIKDLSASGLDSEQIRKAGHFSVDEAKAEELIGCRSPGLIFRYCDPFGRPYKRTDGRPFYRIKPDWGDRKTEDSPKYLSPGGQGCRPYLSRLCPNWAKVIKSTKIDIWETEGEKKADCGCANGLVVVGFGGVDAWVDSCDRKTGKPLPESRVLPELDEITWTNRKVYQCFDSDIIEKLPVQNALAKRADTLLQLGAYPHIVLLPNEIDGSKNGLDDFIVRHGVEALKRLAEAAPTTPLTIETDGTGEEKQTKASLALKELSIFYKALMSWSVLKEQWGFRPGIGWYEWQGRHWTPKSDDEFKAVLTQFMDAQHWHNRAGGHVESICKELRSRLLIREDNWNLANIIGFSNGTLDLKTGTFLESHQPSDRLTQIRPYPFDLSAQCPTWLAFIHEAMEEDIERINLIQAMFRYAILPRPRNQKAEIEKSFDLYGEKGTGKGTTLDVLTKLAGEDNVAAISSETFTKPQGLAQMVDKLLSIDYDASGHLSNIGFFNRVISNEPVEIKKLYRDTCSLRLGTVVVRAYNSHISVPSGSEGLDRRLTVIPFRSRPKRVDSGLATRLEAELAGIFAWCYNLSHAEMRERIMNAGNIRAIAAASLERFEADNPEYRFLCETFPTGASSIRAGQLYQQYREWCSANGNMPKSNVKFSETIKTLNCKKTGKTNGCYSYSIPQMAEFDVPAHLGIVQGESRDSCQDGSNPVIEGNRDGCRQLDSKNSNGLGSEKIQAENARNHSIGKKVEPQPSTILPNADEARTSTVSKLSLAVPEVSLGVSREWQVGDRLRAFSKTDQQWYPGTITALPNTDPNPQKQCLCWKVARDDGGDLFYVWESQSLKPLSTQPDNPHEHLLAAQG